MSNLRILLTGGQGFVGQYIIQTILDSTDWEIVSLARLPIILTESTGPRITWYPHDFRAPLQDDLLAEIGHVDYIIHAGAALTVTPRPDDRTFVQSNVTGTFNLLEAARKLQVQKFIYVSSSEVFGHNRPPGEKVFAAIGDTEEIGLMITSAHKEDDALEPLNVYAASKASAEMLCRSYFKSFGVPIMISRPVNLFGVGQHSCRFVSQVVKALKDSAPIEIFSRDSGHWAILPQVCTRQWLAVEDYADSLIFLLEHGQVGEAYNMIGEEHDHLDIAQRIGAQMNVKPDVQFVEASPKYNIALRLGGEKLRKLGWKPKQSFDERFHTLIVQLAA